MKTTWTFDAKDEAFSWLPTLYGTTGRRQVVLVLDQADLEIAVFEFKDDPTTGDPELRIIVPVWSRTCLARALRAAVAGSSLSVGGGEAQELLQSYCDSIGLAGGRAPAPPRPCARLIPEAEYEEASESNLGWCPACLAFTREHTEPDAEGYDCTECGGSSVVGAEQALLLGLVQFEEVR